jgi:multidrug efflux pump subunit AcrA (membrane-fusion protein)
VARISPALDPRNRTLLVEIELGNPDLALRPGAFAAADIVVDPDRQALTIPAEAVMTFAGVDKVMEVREGVAHEVRIAIGRRDPARVEVLSGLGPGAEVVLTPGNLRSGAAVRVAR